MSEATLLLAQPEQALSLFGTRDQHLRTLRNALGVAISHHEGEVRISGEESAVARATEVLERLKTVVERRGYVEPDEVLRVLGQVTGVPAGPAERVEVIDGNRVIRARTEGQARYIAAIRSHDVVFATGPAGTGKTYLAVALAVEALKKNELRKIVLVRPAVEAGESLGYLPGDLQAKINPYLRPLLDALHEMIDYDQIKRLMELDVIEVIPLAYMRGRTLNDAFIILDEAQNTNDLQIKMFLTRIGPNAKAIITGDPSQVDLPKNQQSGLFKATRILKNIDGIAHIELDEEDVVRHKLVKSIIKAYNREDERLTKEQQPDKK